MNIPSYTTIGTTNSDLRAHVHLKDDSEGDLCKYDEVVLLFAPVEKLQLSLELSLRREKILMELLDEAYREHATPKKLERIVDVQP